MLGTTTFLYRGIIERLLCKHILVVVDNTILSIQMDENQFIVCNDKGYDIAYYESLA